MARVVRTLLALGVLAGCEPSAPPPEAPGYAPRAPAIACPSPPQPMVVPLPAKATAIAVGTKHACALLATGRAMCWGDNSQRQTRDATSGAVSAPHDVGLADVVELSASTYSTCARLASGRTECWGYVSGWNPALAASHPVAPPGAVDRIAAGHDHVCSLTRGVVSCYGVFMGGSFPPARPRIPGIAGATQLAAGAERDCAVSKGEVLCWGRAWSWSCDARCERESRAPIAHRVPGIRDAIAVTVGTGEACALRATGSIACWRASTSSQPPAPTEIPTITDARLLAQRCAVRATGEVVCWGDEQLGQRGDGRTDGHGARMPSRVAGITQAIAVATSPLFACALLADGRVTCWGDNAHAQLGFATPSSSTTATMVCGLARATQLAAQYNSTCALRDDGTVACWGAGPNQLGIVPAHSAVPMPVPAVTAAVELVGRDDAACTRDRTGRVTCWGATGTLVVPTEPVRQIALGRYGLCAITGDNRITCNGVAPIGIVGRATKLAVGDNFACALIDGRAVCWGPGSEIVPPRVCHGCVCEDPPADHRPRVSELHGLVDLAVHRSLESPGELVCGRTTDGRVRCAGPQTALYEQLPRASIHPWSTTVHGVTDVVQIVAGRHHTCALRSNGLVACWGANEVGQLGTGATGIVSAPAR